MSLARRLSSSSPAIFQTAEAELRPLQARSVALELYPSVEAGSAVPEESVPAPSPLDRLIPEHRSIVLFAPLVALIQCAGDFLCLGTILVCLCHHLGTTPYPDFVLAGSSRHSPACASSFLLPVGMLFGTSWFWHRDLAWQCVPIAADMDVNTYALSHPVAV